MTRGATKEEVATVLGWLHEKGGDRLAHTWAWECTPMPCWAPSYEQVEEGMRIAAGEVDINDVLARVYEEMERLASPHKSNERKDDAA